MNDAQLRNRLIVKRLLLASFAFFVAGMLLTVYRINTSAEYTTHLQQISQESTVQAQIDSLTANNSQLLLTIEENGKELVSFSEDKIKYINLASELSLMNNLRINKLTVSDVWQEGEMSGMTTTVEIEGTLSNIRAFVDEYCGTKYVNRVSVVSLRPTGRQAWLVRNIDGDNVLGWFDLTEDNQMYLNQMKEIEAQDRIILQQYGINVDKGDKVGLQIVPVYNPETNQFTDATTGLVLSQEDLDEIPLTLDMMFVEKPMKAYLVIDFLGRS